LSGNENFITEDEYCRKINDKYRIFKKKSEMASEVNEAMISYQSTDDRDVFSLISAVRRGISYFFFRKLAGNSPFSMSEWTHYLHLSERTMQRYKKQEKQFDPLASERILELTMLYKYGMEVFGSKDKLSVWLSSSSVVLGGNTPKSFLDNSFGIQLVRDELGRIEQGVLA